MTDAPASGSRTRCASGSRPGRPGSAGTHEAAGHGWDRLHRVPPGGGGAAAGGGGGRAGSHRQTGRAGEHGAARRQASRCSAAASRTRRCAAGRSRARPICSTWRWPCGRAASGTSSSRRSISRGRGGCSRRRRRKRPAVRLLQHDRDLGHRVPGVTRRRRRSRPEHLRANQGLGRGPGARDRRGPRIAVRDPAARRRLRAARPAPAQAVRRGEPGRFPLFGRGDGRRHMVYVDDVVSGFFKACERDEALGRRSSSPGRGPAPCAS